MVKFIQHQKIGFASASTYLGNLKGALGRVLGGSYVEYRQHKSWIAKSSITPIYPTQELQKSLRVGRGMVPRKKALRMKLCHLRKICQAESPALRSFFVTAFFLAARIADMLRPENSFSLKQQNTIHAVWSRHKTCGENWREESESVCPSNLDQIHLDNKFPGTSRRGSPSGTIETWVDATFGTERRNFMATTGEQQRHPVDNGHFFILAYNTRSTDELLGRRAGFEHKHIKLLHFPLMVFWNLSEYEYNFKKWLHQVGIDERSLTGRHQKYVQLSVIGQNSGSQNFPSQSEQTRQQGEERKCADWVDHTPCRSYDQAEHFSVSRTEPPLGSRKLPLYTPTMTPIDLQKILEWASEKEQKILQWLSDESLYHKTLRDIPKNTRRLYELAKDIDIDDLLRAGIAMKSPDNGSWKSGVRVFGIDEPHKNRRRLIVDCVLLNECIDLDFWGLRTTFVKLFEVCNLVANSEGGAYNSSDYKCWYYQIPISERIRPYFAFRCHGVLYYMCRLPMGFSPAVSIGNSVSQIILKEVFRRLDLVSIMVFHGFMTASNGSREVCAATQVDNSYIFSGLPDVDAAMLQVTKEANILIGEQKKKSSPKVTSWESISH